MTPPLGSGIEREGGKARIVVFLQLKKEEEKAVLLSYFLVHSLFYFAGFLMLLANFLLPS